MNPAQPVNPINPVILSHFQSISAIPRRSRDEARIIAFVLAWAAAHAFPAQRDAVGNLLISIPASPGCESAPSVAIQGHLDMVCEKTPDSPHDFATDAILLIETDGWLHADRTTLGADNGIAVAIAMALAEATDAIHPALELLFTVDEETGLTGALALAPDFVTARLLINLDSEDDEALTVGCAGGEGLDLQFTLERTAASPSAQTHALTVGGLTGGHSGVEIHVGRANAIKLLAQALDRLATLPGFALIALEGGNAHNAIPRDAHATLTLAPAAAAQATQSLVALEADLRAAHAATDPNLFIQIQALPDAPAPAPVAVAIAIAAKGQALLDLLLALPHGVAELSPDAPGLVQTSNNLAAIHTDGDVIALHSSQRSLSAPALAAHTQRLAAIALTAGATAQVSEGYPPWTPDFSSRLLKQTVAAYTALNGHAPRVEVIHAGLECGIIGAKYPGMEMISLGINIREPHTPQERMEIASVDKCWNLLLELLKNLASDPKQSI